jgi:2,3-diaminopropionate biosynthesis protein SbnA
VSGPRNPVVGVLGAIGDTPLIELQRLLGRNDIRVWAKYEAANPGGSSKDRPAARILAEAIADGSVTAATTVIESSSGNMGVGLAQACRYHGIRLICVVDARANAKSLGTLRALGADVRVATPGPGTGGDLLVARRQLVAQLLESVPDAFTTDQYANHSNPAAHAEGTMREIDEALDGEIDHLFVATSTAGTLLGCCDYLRSFDRPTHVVAVDAVGSALFGGEPSARRLPGLGAGIETEHSKWAEFDDLIRVSELECVVGCRRLVEREAFFCGASSGGVAFALASMATQMRPGSRCAMICPDGGAGYLDTVYDDDWVEHALGCGRAELAALVQLETPHAAGAAA